MPVPLLVSNIIEIATEHANMLSIGFKVMTPKGIGWVLSRLTLQMQRYPHFNEYYIITTWIETWNRHFSTRCFKISTTDGEVLGFARTVWMVINLSTHTNAGTTEISFDNSLINTEYECPIPVQKKHRTDMLPEIINSYRFRYTDIDFYGHVNTVRYVELLLNQFPLSKYENNHVHRLEMAFQKEAHYDQQVKIAVTETKQDNYTLSIHNDSQEVILNSRIIFG